MAPARSTVNHTSVHGGDFRVGAAVIPACSARSLPTTAHLEPHDMDTGKHPLRTATWLLAIGLAGLALGCGHQARQSGVAGVPADYLPHAAPHPQPSAAYRWIDIIQEIAARRVDRVGARPTVISREMAIAVTAMYDAWAAYDERAVGTRLGGALRRPPGERTEVNKGTAIAYAVFRSLLFVYPEDAEWMTARMRSLGFDPDNGATDDSPAGIGNRAAAALIAFRTRDGSNQAGDEPGSSGKPYSDYTGYQPVNPPDRIVDPDRWQPITFTDAKGAKFTPGFLTPHWHKVTPFALERSDQFRPPGPPKVGSPELKREVDQVLAYNRSLSPVQKAIVEFMRDGPRSTGQSGHWLRFAQDVSRRDRFGLDQDVKLFFSIGNICFDGFISCWETKRFYDSSRPWTLIHHHYHDQEIRGWAGPGKGVVTMRGQDWHPYSPANFITPPFPGFPSGHATVSAASARILELFTGSDRFGAYELRRAGVLTEEGSTLPAMQAVDGKPAAGLPQTRDEVLVLPTFSATAEMAAVSRAMGGYHIPYDNEQGLKVGRVIADYSWPKYRAYFDGTATVAKAP